MKLPLFPNQSKADRLKARAQEHVGFMFQLAGHISMLPPSKIRENLIARHDEIASKLSSLEVQIKALSPETCPYGYEPTCSLGREPCAPCHIKHGIIRGE